MAGIEKNKVYICKVLSIEKKSSYRRSVENSSSYKGKFRSDRRYCSVPDGSYLLDHVKIETDDKSVKPSDLKSYLRQEPNHRMFGLFRFTLGLYNLSGNDSTKWYNRWVRNAGTPPIIYDPVLIENSRMQMEKANVWTCSIESRQIRRIT